MSLALKRLKVYLKLVALGAAVLLLGLLVVMNRRNTADIWLFHRYEDVNVLWLLLITAVVSVLAWWALGRLRRVLRDFREVRQLQLQQSQREQNDRLARELAEREKRIDEKLRRSITEDS